MRLDGKVAVVTGGASGIGEAACALFVEEGGRVAIVDSDADGATALADRLGAGTRAFESDVGAPGAADAVAAAVEEAWGGIDILVTSAGISLGGTVETTSPDAWSRVFRVHVDGTWLWARAVLPAMRRRGGGSIVTVASQLAVAGGRNNASYIAAKGAILSLTKTMALDHVADGIRVNAVLPGAIDTPLLQRSFRRREDPEAAREASRLRHAMHRFGRPEEVARAMLYLASDESSFVTGTHHVVDGGWLAA